MRRKHIVIGLLSFGLIGLAMYLWAVTVTVTWNENTEADLAGYKVFQRLAGEEYDYTNPAADVVVPPVELPPVPSDGLTYCWVVRAYDTSNNESGNSNEVCKTMLDTIPPQPPTGCDVSLMP